MIVFAEEAIADLERIFEFDFLHVRKIRNAAMLLDEHPEIGRISGPGRLRELVISHGNSGYVALYEYSPTRKLIRVVAIRHQREAGYRGV